MSTDNHLLAGKRIGISISESEDLAELGLDARSINDFTVDICRRLIALGACVVLGHDWRAGGVMEAVAKFALAYRGDHAKPGEPLIRNFLAAPDLPSLSEVEAQDLKDYVATGTVAWEPEFHRKLSDSVAGYARYFSEDVNSRAAHLFAMRCELARHCDLRLIIGGRVSGYQGRVPGLLEETWLSMEYGAPVLCSTGLGGMAESIARPEKLDASKADAATRELFQKLEPHRAGWGPKSLCFPTTSMAVGALIPEIVRVLKHREKFSSGRSPKSQITPSPTNPLPSAAKIGDPSSTGPSRSKMKSPIHPSPRHSTLSVGELLEALLTNAPRLTLGGKVYYVVENDRIVSEENLMDYVTSVCELATGASPREKKSSELAFASIRNRKMRWRAPAVLTWGINKDSFNGNHELLRKTLGLCARATEDWNSAAREMGILNKIRFAPVADGDQAVFQFAFNPFAGNPGLLALGFLPNAPKDERVVYIGPRMLDDAFNRYDQVGIIRHELGHVIGLRHEHFRTEAMAGMTEEEEMVMEQWMTGLIGAEDLSKFDGQSVMRYLIDPDKMPGNYAFEISPTDKKGFAALYGAPYDDATIREFEI